MASQSNFRKLKIVYFGSAGSLSLVPFNALLKSPHEIQALVVYDPRLADSRFNVMQTGSPGSVQAVAYKSDIPVIRLCNEFTSIEKQLKALQPDVIVTSCFNRKLPESLLAVPKIASINIHPSLLPAYRGPAPVFWQLRDNVETSGISLHLMSKNFDAGAVIAQERVGLEKIVHYSELIRVLAHAGAKLLLASLENIVSVINESKAQEENESSYQSLPALEDYSIPMEWDARRIVRFMEITQGMTAYYPITIKGKSYKLLHISSYDFNESINFSDDGIIVCFNCSKGYICAEILTE